MKSIKHFLSGRSIISHLIFHAAPVIELEGLVNILYWKDIMANNNDIIGLIREKDTYAHKLGIQIIEANNGSSHVTMQIDETTANAIGNVHGGVIFSLADLAFATACNSQGILSVAIESNIHYMAPCPSEGRLDAVGIKIGETRRLGFYRIEVFPPNGDIIAVVQCIAYKKG